MFWSKKLVLGAKTSKNQPSAQDMVPQPKSQPAATMSPPPSRTPTPSYARGATHNANHGPGTFNNVKGNQHFDSRTTHHGNTHGGDYFAGPIQGGNVGGRGNTNAIHNGANPVDPPKRPGGGGNSKMQGLEARADDLQSEIDRMMNEMGLTEEQKLERKISELQITYRSLQRELATESSTF